MSDNNLLPTYAFVLGAAAVGIYLYSYNSSPFKKLSFPKDSEMKERNADQLPMTSIKFFDQSELHGMNLYHELDWSAAKYGYYSDGQPYTIAAIANAPNAFARIAGDHVTPEKYSISIKR